jgi:putative transposase
MKAARANYLIVLKIYRCARDKLRSYGVAHRELIPGTIHSTQQYESNPAEQSQGRPRFMGMKRRGSGREG